MILKEHLLSWKSELSRAVPWRESEAKNESAGAAAAEAAPAQDPAKDQTSREVPGENIILLVGNYESAEAKPRLGWRRLFGRSAPSGDSPIAEASSENPADSVMLFAGIHKPSEIKPRRNWRRLFGRSALKADSPAAEAQAENSVENIVLVTEDYEPAISLRPDGKPRPRIVEYIHRSSWGARLATFLIVLLISLAISSFLSPFKERVVDQPQKRIRYIDPEEQKARRLIRRSPEAVVGRSDALESATTAK